MGSGYIFAADEEVCAGPAEITEALSKLGRALPIILYSERAAPDQVVSAMLEGAYDYLRWPFEPNILRTTLRRLADTGERRAQLEAHRSRAAWQVTTLTTRERQVLILMSQGQSNKEIGVSLNISPRTVEIHRSHMMRKIGANSTADAVRMALQAGLDDEFRYAA